MNKWWCLFAGIFVVGALEAFAISQGIDGAALAGAIGAIGVMVGLAFGQVRKVKT